MTDNTEPVKRKKGGAQPGAGRPKGKLNKSTVQAMAVKREYLEKVRNNADRLFNAQMNLAEGVTMLFKVEKDDKGNSKKPELVTSQDEISQFIEECGGYDGQMNGDTYYFLTTKIPDSRTITDMLDRALGKPDQKLLIGDDEPDDSPYQELTAEELRKLAS
jgi:hypothetical protein